MTTLQTLLRAIREWMGNDEPSGAELIEPGGEWIEAGCPGLVSEDPLSLIQHAAGCNGYLVVPTNHRAAEAVRRAAHLGVDINFPLTFHEVLRGDFHTRGCSPLWIDDRDAFIQHAVGRAQLGAP